MSKVAAKFENVPAPTPEAAEKLETDMDQLRRICQLLNDEKTDAFTIIKHGCALVAEGIAACETQVQVLNFCEKIGPMIQMSVNLGLEIYQEEHPVMEPVKNIIVPGYH